MLRVEKRFRQLASRTGWHWPAQSASVLFANANTGRLRLPVPPSLLLLAAGWLSFAAPCLAEEPTTPPTLVIANCSLFDPESKTLLPERTIVIERERIKAVGSPEAPVETPAGARVIDGRGKFVLPGLIDAHTHMVHISDYAFMTGDELLPMYLAGGVTSVRSTGEEVVAATLVARYAREHPQHSPRVFTCSPLIDRDPPIHRDIGRAVTDVKDVPKLVDDMSRWGVTTLKIYAGTQRAIGQAVIAEGQRRGFVVTAHLGPYAAADAVADGIDCIEHITSTLGYIPSAKDEPPRENLPPGVANAHGPRVFIDPTLIVFRNMILLPDDPAYNNHADNTHVPQRLKDFWPTYIKRHNLGTSPQADRRKAFAGYLEHTRALHAAGVRLLVGTDAPEPYCPPGFSMHQELEMLVEAGLTPADALRAATLHNAIILRQTEHLGTIAPGKLADLVILSKNPLVDIRHTRAIEHVVRGGIVCQPAELLKLVPKE